MTVLLLTFQGSAKAYPGYLRRIDTIEDWESIALGSPGIKHVVPGPDPDSLGPGREPVPGAADLPCLDFVLYGPGVQHIDIILATGLDCLQDFTVDDMNRMRRSMTQFAGYIGRVPDPAAGEPAGGGVVYAVTIHNDIFPGPPEITPWHVSYVMKQLRRTFNEAALGRLVYNPLSTLAKDRARRWLSDPAIELDFEVYFPALAGDGLFIRGDATGDGGIDLSDAILILNYLFVRRKCAGRLPRRRRHQ